jgi:hypothetical protein
MHAMRCSDPGTVSGSQKRERARPFPSKIGIFSATDKSCQAATPTEMIGHAPNQDATF